MYMREVILIRMLGLNLTS